MPKVRASSGMIGTISLPSAGSRSSWPNRRTNAIVDDASRPTVPFRNSSTHAQCGCLSASFSLAMREEPAQLAAARQQVLHLIAFASGLKNAGRRVARDRDAEAVAEFDQLFFVQLLLVMRDVAALASLAEAVALHRLGEDHSRRAFVLGRSFVRRVDLLVVVATARQLGELLVGQVLDELQQLRVLAKEVLADERAVADDVLLVLPVRTSPMRLISRPGWVSLASSSSLVAPDHLITFQPAPRNRPSSS